MPRPPTLTIEELVEECKKLESTYVSAAIGVFKADLWTQLAKKFNGKYSSKYLYLIFKDNRHDILGKLGLNKQSVDVNANSDENFEGNDEAGIIRTTEEVIESESSEEDSSELKGFPEKRFTITLSKDEWMKIEPRETIYQSKDKSNPSRITRLYYVLPKESQWTCIINEHFWAHVKLPCSLSYKRAKVQSNGVHFLIINGRCTECGSEFVATMNKEPKEDSLALLQCTYIGDFNACRSSKKRRLCGKLREELAEKFISSKESATFFRGKLINANMELGDFEPSHIPTLNAFRTLKSNFKKKESLHSDPIQALLIMKYTQPFSNVIHHIGLDPFAVYYWTNSQVSVFNTYCSKTHVPSVGIDATGGLIKEIQRPYSNVSKHIFLYSVCVYDVEAKTQYSVCNMLSERHTGLTILNFLNYFFKQSGPVEIQIPKEVVCDHSVALLTAIVQCFTNFHSLQEYLANCAKIIVDASKIQKPKCFVRCDVAHTVKIIASWHPLKGATWRTRAFYIRSVCLLIQCNSINIMENILFRIFVVALSPDGGSDALGRQLSCEEAKSWLQMTISTAFPDYDDGNEESSTRIIIGGTLVNLADAYNLDAEELYETGSEPPDETELTLENVSFRRWGESIKERARKTVSGQASSQDNLQFLPKLPDCILSLIETTPLWSAVMTSIFGYGAATATDAHVESIFNDVKNRMLGHVSNLSSNTLPVDQFLMYHVSHIEQTLIVKESKSKTNGGVNFVQEKPEDSVSDAQNFMDNNPAETLHSDGHRSESHAAPPCPLCVEGHTQEGAHRCMYCNAVVHIIFQQCGVPVDGSEEGHGQKAVCAKCLSQQKDQPIQVSERDSSSAINDSPKEPDEVSQRMSENSAVENWKGKGHSQKKRKRSYLRPDPDFINVNLSSKSKPNPIGLLLNGLRFNELQPVSISKDKYILSNTCAYDSIVQLLACAYSDSASFRSFVSKQPANAELWKTVMHMNKQGVTAWPYRWRAQLLSSICQVIQLNSGIKKICAEFVVPNMFGKLLKDYPSITCEEKCPSREDQYKKTYISLNMKAEAVENLGSLIQDSLKPRDEKCSFHNDCTQSTIFELSPNYLGIEMQDLNGEKSQDSFPIGVYGDKAFGDGIELRLKEIPREIQVNSKTFFLRGAVGMSDAGGKKSINVLGHYKSFCHRGDGFWELYNDLEKTKMSCRLESKITCEFLFYTV